MAKTKLVQKEGFNFPLGRMNFIILGIGMLLLVSGFFVMGIADHPDDFITLTLAPIILVVAFVVVIPYGIMYREREQQSDTTK